MVVTVYVKQLVQPLADVGVEIYRSVCVRVCVQNECVQNLENLGHDFSSIF